MDKVLKARSLSSASARRKRIQEREEERQQARQSARERALDLHDLNEDDPSASESDDETAESHHSRQDSFDSSSDYSVKTPDDTPQAVHNKTPSLAAMVKPNLQLLVPEISIPPTVDNPSSTSASTPAPKLNASLSRPSDFQYDRYSILVDSPQDIVMTPDTDIDDQYSPCEIATPVSFRLPLSRPAVISISGRSSGNKRRTSSGSSMTHVLFQQSQPSPQIPSRSERRVSQTSSRSGFLASEANAIQVPDLPPNAMYMIANASRDSLALSTHSVEPLTRPVNTRKNSMPLLSAAIKSSHTRISSIRGLVKSPTAPPSSMNRPESRQSRPRTSVSAADIMNDSFQAFETVPANLNELQPPPSRGRLSLRPMSSHSALKKGSMTALPTPPADDSRPNVMEQVLIPSPERTLRQKKSFSTLRKRSESISNAIKFVSGSKKSSRDSKLPPMPTPPPIPSPLSSRSTMDFHSFPSPPPPIPSPRDQLRQSVSSSNYSPFPPAANRESKGMVGLGIGLRV